MVILKKWHLRLILTKETYSKILVWVNLFNIPHEYLNEEGLSHIASAVGKPIYAESLTESMKRISYARVCIEIDATYELLDSFDLFMGDNLGPNLGESVEILPPESSSNKKKKNKKKRTAKKGKDNSSQAKDWDMLDNYNNHDLGRIWIGWDPRILKITKIKEIDQIIHCHACILDSNDWFHISFVYGSNVDSSRRALWHSMCSIKHGTSWIVLVNFNVSRRVNESVGDFSRISLAMEEFNDCLLSYELDDLRFSGFLHTWCNMRSSGCISKKLDRVLVNKEWMAKYEHSEAIFLPSSISDHSPFLVKPGSQAF
ncbi:hypothetical protein Dsin_018778 [Dipteronia sinensis]|uniref:DUF4283 domain-containing protein n=1 Tax=Dipteronia sinensis TaxID=43782 RepID=A0AAE0E1W6_9ROSI|nr:hypothetical protein Dsin_018778 [Dipteronia sinensis]